MQIQFISAPVYSRPKTLQEEEQERLLNGTSTRSLAARTKTISSHIFKPEATPVEGNINAEELSLEDEPPIVSLLESRGFAFAPTQFAVALSNAHTQSPEFSPCKNIFSRAKDKIKSTAKKVKNFVKEHPVITAVIVVAVIAVTVGIVAGVAAAGAAAAAAGSGKEEENKSPLPSLPSTASSPPPPPKDKPLMNSLPKPAAPQLTYRPDFIKQWENPSWDTSEQALYQPAPIEPFQPKDGFSVFHTESAPKHGFQQVLAETPGIAAALFNRGDIRPSDFIVPIAASKPAPVRDPGEKPLPKMKLFFINGILNDQASAIEGAKYTASTSKTP